MTGGTNANVYVRSSSTIFLDHSVSGSAINGVAAFNTLAYEAASTPTFNGRNGYGATFTSANTISTANNQTFTNNLNGDLRFTGTFWNNTDSAGNRTLTLQGNGNTFLAGNLLATNSAGNHTFVKTGTGAVTITSTGATLDGSVTINQGSLSLADFRSINNTGTFDATSRVINIGSGTSSAILNIGGTSTAATALGLSTGSRTINLSGTTGGATINALQTQTFPVLINGTLTASGVGPKLFRIAGTASV